MRIALTFDIERDIPNVLDTYFGAKTGILNILKILDNFNIKGTFFCTGNVVEHLPKYIKLIERNGHEIGCHSFNHERLNQINLKKCQNSIYQNKKIVENTCQNSEIIGFRAPYLKPPKFIFKVLNNLGFKYDSSIKSYNKLKYYQINNYKIQEFHPSNLNMLFRLPMGYSFLRKWIFRNGLIVLCFHPWETINVKNLIFNKKNFFEIVKNIIFRPDRVGNTGDVFIRRLAKFIQECFSKKAEFVRLNQLIIEKD
ncbi:MAG: polysaccharide deacetylase family protein [Promethearchaeota archaeon]